MTDFASLSQAQRAGWACVVCGVDYTRTAELIPNEPVGTVDGEQVFACACHGQDAWARPAITRGGNG